VSLEKPPNKAYDAAMNFYDYAQTKAARMNYVKPSPNSLARKESACSRLWASCMEREGALRCQETNLYLGQCHAECVLEDLGNAAGPQVELVLETTIHAAFFRVVFLAPFFRGVALYFQR
jgi:hypothetical protein